ncbi:hypothetical protein [Bradyrhizobium sp. HKCCYLR20261]|uniref:hypothetical protein n=1 Tax=Bradyrhizobium sp. HKCCYLR20261 TaxID=3420760 RepID=UPI003EB6B3BF
MAVFQLLLKGTPQVEPNSNPAATWFFDDGRPEQPGDDGFTTESVRAYVAAQGKLADGFNYVGQSPEPPAA